MRRSLTVLFAGVLFTALAPIAVAGAEDCVSYEIRFEAEGPPGGPLVGPIVMRADGSGLTYHGEVTSILVPEAMSEATFDIPDVGSITTLTTHVFGNSSNPSVVNSKGTGEVIASTGVFEGAYGATGSSVLRSTFEILEDSWIASGRIGVELCFADA